MKLSLSLPILHLAWTVQAYAGLEPVRLGRDITPRNLRSVNVGQAMFARDLTPVETYMSSALVKRVTPPGSPQRGRSPQRSSFLPPTHERSSGGGQIQPATETPRNPGVGLSKWGKAAVGLAAAGTITGIAGSTEWQSQAQGIPAVVGMACVGAAALTAACAHKLRPQYALLTNGARTQSPPQRQTNPAAELQTVPPPQGAGPSRSARPNSPADLVRR